MNKYEVMKLLAEKKEFYYVNSYWAEISETEISFIKVRSDQYIMFHPFTLQLKFIETEYFKFYAYDKIFFDKKKAIVEYKNNFKMETKEKKEFYDNKLKELI